MKIPSMNAFRGRKHAPKKSKSSRRSAAEDPAETPPMVASSAQRRSSTSRSRQQPSGSRHVQEPEGCPATTIPLRPTTQQDSSPTTPRQTNRTIITPRSSVDSPPQAPTTTLHRQKSPSSSKSTLSRRDYGRGSGGGRSSREGRDRSTSMNSNSIPEDAPVVDSRTIPPLPLRAQQQQQQHQPPPPKRKSSQSSQQQQRRPSKELGLDHLSLLSPPPDPDNFNHNNPTTNNIPSSSASVTSINTIDTVTRSAAQLQSLIEQMQLEVTKLRSSKHAAECRANRLESDMERMTQEMENSVLKMGMENERLKGEVEGWRLRCEELEREVKRAAANSSGSHGNSGGNVNGMNVESGKKECIQIKTKTSDGTNSNNNKQKRHRSSDLSSSNNSNTSINSKSSNSRRSSKSQCHSGTNITPTSSPLFGKELMALSYERATPKRNNKLESSAVKSSSSGGGSDHPPHHVKSRNNTHNNNNNNEHYSSSSSSSSSSKAERTVDASSCASPYDHGGIWTPQGIKSGRMMDRQHDQMRSGGRGGEKVIDELVVDELYYA